MIVDGIDPGKSLGFARVDIGRKITVIECTTLTGVEQLHPYLDLVGSKIAVEWWEYQGPAKSRGVPHQAEAAGRVAGYLTALGLTFTPVKRGDVLSALSLPRNSNKLKVRATIHALTGGVRPSNDHEADAVAVAIAASNQLEVS